MPRREGPGGARHFLGDGWHARLVPADSLVDDVGTRRLHRRRLGSDFGRRQPALYEVDRGDAENDQEVAPDAIAHDAHDFHG